VENEAQRVDVTCDVGPNARQLLRRRVQHRALPEDQASELLSALNVHCTQHSSTA
jgi:hypothetical protein